MKYLIFLIFLFITLNAFSQEKKNCSRQDIIYVELQDEFIKQTLSSYMDSMSYRSEKWRNGEGYVYMYSGIDFDSGFDYYYVNAKATDPRRSLPPYYTVVNGRVVVLYADENKISQELICVKYRRRSIRKFVRTIKPFLPPPQIIEFPNEKRKPTKDELFSNTGYIYGHATELEIRYDKDGNPYIPKNPYKELVKVGEDNNKQ